MVNRLKEIRTAAGYPTARDFAEKHGIAYDTYTSYESGKRNLSLAKAWELADILGCTLDEIAGREPQGNDSDDLLKQWLIDSYEQCTTERKRRLVEFASDQASMSMNQDDASNKS